MTLILGLSAFYHDSAAALLDDGRIVAAAQEERFSRRKHDARFPHAALEFCLDQTGVAFDDVDHVVFYEKPFLKFERLLETYLAFAPRGFPSFAAAMPVWLREKLFQKDLLVRELRRHAGKRSIVDRLLFGEHHQSHAASAYYPSPFDEAVVLTLDGVGEWATTSVAIGRGSDLELVRELHFPHSLGLLYSAFTYYLGFRVNSGEYKLMGLAPYGQPRYRDLILERLVDLGEDGSYWLDQSFFDYCTGLRMTNKRFHDLFGGPPRDPDEPLTERHMDVAASIQAVTDEAVLRLTRSLAAETGIANLCLAGGVALNCVANGKVLRDGAFRNIWIQPAAGDAGGALGCALSAHHIHLGHPRSLVAGDAMQGAYLGPAFDQAEIVERLTALGARFSVLPEENLIDRAAEGLEGGRALGWFQGRMEFGPRALGARSILGDARSPSMQRVLNLKIKYRESFRPFAPSVLREDVAGWFELDVDSPYMLLVGDVRQEHRVALSDSDLALSGLDKLNAPRSNIPAVTHVDLSARIQTVHAETNPRYHRLIAAFKERSGCPVIVNTSFNVRGEPIVCTPEDAFRCFMGTEIDALAIGDCWLEKNEQNPALRQDYRNAFALD